LVRDVPDLPASVARIDLLQPELFSVPDSVRFGKSVGCFDDLLGFHDLLGLQTMMLEEGPQRSLGEPRTRLGLTCFGKKLHRSFAKTRARERQHLCFPA
jgi:hypothetical protein